MRSKIKTIGVYGLIIGLPTVLFGYIFLYRLPKQQALEAATKLSSLSSRLPYRSVLDGRPVKSKAEALPQVVAVMIDNHPTARPQSGLAKARVVYEAPVEGGMTRYLALFEAKDAVDMVGPVRSARVYLIDWIQEYGRPLYLHAGGSPGALAAIRARNIFEAEEQNGTNYYWRSEDRLPPHNLYTSSAGWQKALAESAAGKPMPVGSGWKFAPSLGNANKKLLPQLISINFDASNIVSWLFDPARALYARSINAEKQSDASGAPIMARNVIVQEVAMKTIDDDGRQELATIGKGTARIFKNGEAISGSWKKGSLTGRTRFYDAKGKEVALAPGVTWVEIVAKGMTIEIGK